MENFDDEYILNGIAKNDVEVLKFIYRNYYGRVSFLVNKYGGNAEDAENIFQDSVLYIFRKLKENDLKIGDFGFGTYFLSVCQFKLLKRLDEKTRLKNENNEDKLTDNISGYFQINNQDYFYNKLEKLSEKEIKLLELYFNKIDEKKIIEIMEFKNIKQLNQALSSAKQHVAKIIKSDPKFKKKVNSELSNYFNKQKLKT